MQYATLKQIVNGLLLRKGYPKHFYMSFLVAARDCLRELSLDDLQIVNTVLLDVNKFWEVQLPCDYVDIVGLSERVGQFLRPLPSTEKINPLPNYDGTGTQIPYNQPVNDTSNALISDNVFGFTSVFWFTQTINEYGENIGRLFGWGAGRDGQNYTVVKERGIIQLNQDITATQVVLQYISNGMCCDAASQVDYYAWQCIDRYVNLEQKRNNRNSSLGEIQMAEAEYIKERKILRARMQAMPIADLRRIVQKAAYASPHYQ